MRKLRRRKLRRRNLDVDSTTLKSFEDVIRKEIVTLCSEAISIARDLVEKDKEESRMSAIERIFLIKMVGDYNRYMGEFLPKGHPCVNAALQAYSNPMKAAEGIALRMQHVLTCLELFRISPRGSEQFQGSMHDCGRGIQQRWRGFGGTEREGIQKYVNDHGTDW